MRLIAPTALAALVLLSACSSMREPEVIEQAAVVTAESFGKPASDASCLPDDDGIDGTGCEVD